jgi:hypothetical protein
MTGFKSRSATYECVVAGLAIVIALASGIEGIGKPLRLVQVLTIVPLGVIAGLALGRALALVRDRRKTNGGE